MRYEANAQGCCDALHERGYFLARQWLFLPYFLVQHTADDRFCTVGDSFAEADNLERFFRPGRRSYEPAELKNWAKNMSFVVWKRHAEIHRKPTGSSDGSKRKYHEILAQCGSQFPSPMLDDDSELLYQCCRGMMNSKEQTAPCLEIRRRYLKALSRAATPPAGGGDNDGNDDNYECFSSATATVATRIGVEIKEEITEFPP